MTSSILPFDELLENIQDDTGLKSLASQVEKIKRFIIRAERMIGYSGAIVKKKIKYDSTLNNFNGSKISIPTDLIKFSAIKDSNGPILNHEYYITKEMLVFTDPTKVRKDIWLYYNGIMFDGFGNPIVTRDHGEAVQAFIVWKLFGAKAYLDPTRHARGTAKSYEQDWKDYRDAAQGDDAWPTTAEDWAMISLIGNMSSHEAQSLLYLYDNLECDIAMEMQSECVLKPEELMINVYDWQYGDTVSNIAIAQNIDQNYLDDIATKSPIADFNKGKTIAFNKIGRISFALQGAKNNEFRIYDILNQDITEVVFNNYYNDLLKLDIYISKEFYSHSNMFFKFIKNAI